MKKLSEKEYKALKEKAEKWDKLESEISEFYCDETGEYSESNPKREGDLGDIGLVAAQAFGWL